MKKIENAGLAFNMTTIDQILVGKVNELIDEVEKLKIQLSRVHKDRSDPKTIKPYDLFNKVDRRRRKIK